MRTVIPLLLMIVTLSGCAHKFTREKVELAIVNGKTTKNEILESFGAPDKKVKTPGMKIVSGTKEYVIHKSLEVWWYSPHQLKWLDVLEPETLKIIFDDKGVVTHFDFEADD